MPPILGPCWITGAPPNAVAALPRGLSGRVGGQMMRLGNAAEQREIAALLAGRPDGCDIVEVGCGPGALLAGLARDTTATLIGIDPSEEMRTMAVRALARPVANGRVRIVDGAADRTGLDAGCADLVVSVNTVAIWPDLDEGLRELGRILRPGGMLVLGWHGGRRPSRFARSLVLPDRQLDAVGTALAHRFTEVRRVLTRRCTVFTARTRSPRP